ANFSQYNSTGGNQWYRVKGSITPYEVAIGKNNTVFFSGTGLGSASVLFAFNLTGGDYWNVSPVDHFGTSGVGLGVDSNGSAYIIADDGNQDTGIIKYHGNGNLAWRRNLTNYKGYDLAVDINDSIFAVGDDGGAPASVIINKYNTAGKIVLNRSFNGTITDIACNTFCYTIGTNHTGGNTDNIVAKWYANNLSQVWNFTIGTTGIIAIAPPYTPAVVAADSTVPNVTFSNPSNGTNASNDFIAFNATIYEENPDTVLFEVSNGTKPFNITATNISGNWNANINMSTLIEDVHNITIFANDTTDNRNDTIFIQIKVDRTGPVMFLANTSFNTTDRTPDITYNFTDAAFNANCSLYFDGVWNISNDATANNTNTIITPSSGMLDGTYVTTINCTDPSNNTGNSSALIVLVDNAKPNVTFVGPVNGTNLSSGLVQFNATVVDATGVDTILFEFSNGTKPFNLTGNNITDVWNVTVNISAMIEDLHTVQLFVNDTAGNRNDSVNITVLVDRTGPSMTLANTSFNTSDTTPSFTFNFTDASVSSNCT
ncbi:MAG: hypothetical protein QF535_23810, partial [Anaerolineales bacterium]|nr:hypothetical protein [Anaerolineales bacterium]